MKTVAYDSITDSYSIMEIDIALKKEHIHTFHPQSVNQLDIDAAVGDGKDIKNGYLLAQALTEQLTKYYYWNDLDLRDLVRQLSIRVNGGS